MRLDLPREGFPDRDPKAPAADRLVPLHPPERMDDARATERPTSAPNRLPRSLPLRQTECAMRPGEQKILAEVGRFRLVSRSDLAEALRVVEGAQIEADLAFLRKKGW